MAAYESRDKGRVAENSIPGASHCHPRRRVVSEVIAMRDYDTAGAGAMPVSITCLNVSDLR